MYRHSVPHTTNPFTAPAGKKSKQKIEYCVRTARVMDKWFAETGNKLFKQQSNLWWEKIKLIDAKRI